MSAWVRPTQVRCATEGVSNSLEIICAMGAVVAPLPEPPAEQVTETKLGESLHRLPATSRAVSRVSSPLGGNISNEMGAVPWDAACLKTSSTRISCSSRYVIV